MTRLSKLALWTTVVAACVGSLALGAELGKRDKLSFIDRESEWSIATYVGESLESLGPNGEGPTPCLTRDHVTGLDADYVADPFMIRTETGWAMMFEVKNSSSGHGDIGFATSSDGRSWSYRGIAIDEPYHMAYPYVFQWEGEHYLMPMAAGSNSLRLYKAKKFPSSWEYAGDVMKGVYFDASIFRHDGRWWILTISYPDSWSTLRLYTSETLIGGWAEHPASPIVKDNPSAARGAGRIIRDEDGLIRFAQDCSNYYGQAVRAFRITRLTKNDYQEIPLSDSPILKAGSGEWNEKGMHHIDAHRLPDGTWFASVDGFRRTTELAPRWK